MRTNVKYGIGALLGICLFPAVAMASSGVDAFSITHRMMLLVIQLGVILFAAKIGNILFEKIHLPGTLGELIAGIAIGPFALGMFSFYGFEQGLFPIHGVEAISPELNGICAVAAVVLLFVVGLETDIALLLRYSIAGAVVGIGGVVVSFVFGAGIVEIFYPELGFFSPQGLILGTVMTATSVGITARILSEKRKLDSPEGVTILSAAVIDDVIGIILLAVVMGVTTANDLSHIGVIAAKAVGVWLAATAIGLLASRKIGFLLKWFGKRTSIAIMALGLALILAGLFEEAGLAMIIGAYVMGLSLSRADISRVIREKLEPIYELLIPVFFCVMGMRINFSSLGSPGVLTFGLLYALVALGSKVLGAGLPAMLANFNLRGAMRIGFGMAPRCEVALIIAGIALGANLLSDDLFAAVVIMVLINTIVAPPALALLYRNDASGTRRDVDVGQRARAKVSFELPSLEMADFLIGKLTGIFESEGFFVHTLSRRHKLYQLRKDRTIIDYRHSGTSLAFTCKQGDIPLINTAMYEATAALEQAIRGLKAPLDTQSLAGRIQDDSSAETQMLSLKDYLKPELIEPDLKGSTKAEVIDELLDVLSRNGLLPNVTAARDAVWKREESMSTGLQYGVAIPHGKTDTVSRLVCAVGIHRRGIDFEAMDHRPSKIFFLTLSPINKPAPHVQFMSTVSQVLNSHGRERLLVCGSAGEIFNELVTPRAAKPRRFRAPKPPATKFNLADYLSPEVLEPNLQGNTKQEVIEELLALLDKRGMIGDLDIAKQAVLDREKQMSTGMEEGVAIPHGRTDAVDNLVCAVGVKRDGLDFGSADGKPTQIIVMALTSTSGTDPYLQFAAAIIGVLDEDGRKKILSAQTPEELYKTINNK